VEERNRLRDKFRILQKRVIENEATRLQILTFNSWKSVLESRRKVSNDFCDARILRGVLRAWQRIERPFVAEQQQKAVEMALSFHHRKLKKESFFRLKAAVREAKAGKLNNLRAWYFRRRVLLHGSFRNWKDFAADRLRVAKKCAAFIRVRELSLQRFSFDRWAELVYTNQEERRKRDFAAEFYVEKLKSFFFRIWADYAVSRLLKKHSSEVVASHFRQVELKFALRKLSNNRKMALQMKLAKETARIYLRQRSLAIALHRLKLNVERREQARIALHKVELTLEKFLQRRTWSAFKNAIQNEKEHMVNLSFVADSFRINHEYKRLLHEALLVWKERVTRMQLFRLVFSNIETKSNERKARSVFERLSNEVCMKRVAALQMRKAQLHHDHKIMQKSFSKWRQLYEWIQHLRRQYWKAFDFDYRKCITKTWIGWTRFHAKVQEKRKRAALAASWRQEYIAKVGVPSWLELAIGKSEENQVENVPALEASSVFSGAISDAKNIHNITHGSVQWLETLVPSNSFGRVRPPPRKLCDAEEESKNRPVLL